MTAVGVLALILVCIAIGVFLGSERRVSERQRLEARRWNLWHREQELLNAAELRGCPSCQLLRRRDELQRPPTE